jgi:hypothetical protein
MGVRAFIGFWAVREAPESKYSTGALSSTPTFPKGIAAGCIIGMVDSGIVESRKTPIRAM